MQYSVTLWHIGLWLAVVAILLLATAEIISPYHGRTNLIIEKEKLRKAALLLAILFLIAVAVRTYEIITSA